MTIRFLLVLGSALEFFFPRLTTTLSCISRKGYICLLEAHHSISTMSICLAATVLHLFFVLPLTFRNSPTLIISAVSSVSAGLYPSPLILIYPPPINGCMIILPNPSVQSHPITFFVNSLLSCTM